MPGKKSAGENSKKAAGQARKAEQAASKKAGKDREVEAAESANWEKGSKDNSKKEAAANKAAEAARKKAERDALEAEEMASMKSAKTGNVKSAQKKQSGPARKGLDLAQLDDASPAHTTAALNATGIENALDALDITAGKNNDAIDRHPERRFKAAYNAYEERRLEEMKDEKGLRRQQKIDQIRKEFEKHPDNPFNKANAVYNSTREEVADLRNQERDKTERRLAAT